MVACELTDWFDRFSPDRSPVIDRLGETEYGVNALGLLGRRRFFTDANSCMSRVAGQRVPFRDVA